MGTVWAPTKHHTKQTLHNPSVANNQTRTCTQLLWLNVSHSCPWSSLENHFCLQRFPPHSSLASAYARKQRQGCPRKSVCNLRWKLVGASVRKPHRRRPSKIHCLVCWTCGEADAGVKRKQGVLDQIAADTLKMPFREPLCGSLDLWNRSWRSREAQGVPHHIAAGPFLT